MKHGPVWVTEIAGGIGTETNPVLAILYMK